VAVRYDGLFIDLDGVIYRGDLPVARAAESLEAVRDLGLRIVFLTNNSARTPQQVAEKLGGLGIRAKPSEVLTSALATAAMLGKQAAGDRVEATARPPAEGRGPPVRETRAFVIGERGIREALASAGISIVDGDPDHTDIVVVGWDRSVDYPKLRRAALLVQRGARLIATNQDASYPAPDGLWPGAGAILAALTTATGAAPTVVGKPHRPLFEAAAEMAGSHRPLVVGDRLDTDILGASRMGWDSLLVLTGSAEPKDLPRADALPTFIGNDLSTLFQDVPPFRSRAARAADEGAIARLLERSGLSPDGVGDRLGSTHVVEDETVHGASPAVGSPLLATASLQEVDGAAVLRSVAVRPDLRGRGIGLLMVATALRIARRRGIRTVALFTETAPGFFEQLGFRRVDRAALPESVRSSGHALEECSVLAVPMMLQP
jgi:glycerol 3-phosphatase-2